MQDSAKYLIHADIEANGVVERSDVVGAIFGQTEGLLGNQLDLRALQGSSKVGRIDVTIESESGRSTGEITIASGLDRVETAILAASLESIDRVGPCRSTIEVTHLEDVRTAKRREIVDRAEQLLDEFDREVMSSAELIEEVRHRARIDRITEYEGYPAGPRAEDSDAIIIVEGRSDVLTLLQFGIKNAIAVEGTNVPDTIADLTRDRTVTAFLDSDRGGDLILKELDQVGTVDYVAFAPNGKSVEDLARKDVTRALREKVPFEAIEEIQLEEDTDSPTSEQVDSSGQTETDPAEAESTARDESTGGNKKEVEAATACEKPESATASEPPVSTTPPESGDQSSTSAEATLEDHVSDVLGASLVRLVDASFSLLAEAPAEDAFEAIRDADTVPEMVVLDGEVTQRILDVSAQRGVDRIVGTDRGEFVKQPASVRVTTVEQI